jgi:hypothetical protein
MRFPGIHAGLLIVQHNPSCILVTCASVMVIKLTQVSQDKLEELAERALWARAHKQRCRVVAFDGEEEAEYVLEDAPDEFRWKEDDFEWQQIRSSSLRDDKGNDHAYRIFRKSESMYVVLLW